MRAFARSQDGERSLERLQVGISLLPAFSLSSVALKTCCFLQCGLSSSVAFSATTCKRLHLAMNKETVVQWTSDVFLYADGRLKLV